MVRNVGETQLAGNKHLKSMYDSRHMWVPVFVKRIFCPMSRTGLNVYVRNDRDDILCCHVLRLLTQLGIHKIPDAYIKERWTTSYLEDAVKKQKMIRTN